MSKHNSNGLVIFDCDGVLLCNGGSWGVLHDELGTKDEHEELLDRYQDGQLSFREWTAITAGLWKEQSVIKLNTAANTCQLTHGMRQVITEIADRGFRLGIVSGGVAQIINRLPLREKFDFVIANELDTVNGRLTGDIDIIVTPKNKKRHISSLSRTYNICSDTLVLIGDSKWDLQKPTETTISIAFNADFTEQPNQVDHSLDIEQAKQIPELIAD